MVWVYFAVMKNTYLRSMSITVNYPEISLMPKEIKVNQVNYFVI